MLVGGAPANVSGAYIKLGGPAAMITQLGQDAFGDRIVDEFVGHGIDVSHVLDRCGQHLSGLCILKGGREP